MRQLNLFNFDDDIQLFHLVNSSFQIEENFEIEFKSAENGFPKDLWKSYSAFANTNTGVIVLGVKEERSRFYFEGLSEEQLNKYQKNFWNNCNNPQVVSKNLLSNEDVKILDFKDKRFLAIRVPFASRTERPVYLTTNPFGNTYKRNHEGDYRCTDEEVKRMLADSSSTLNRDGVILEGFTIDDLDKVSIRQFRQLFSSSKGSHPWLALEDLDFLKKIGAYRVDRKSREEGITLAGLLMFGKEDGIKNQDIVPNYFPEYREKLITDNNVRWSDRIYPDGTWECNLFQFYLKVWPKLIATLPKPFQINKDERIDDAPTHIAIREAFVNALVHTDYSVSGNILVELDTEKFVFTNPGTLLVSIHQYYAGGISECRNPSLQQMFMLIGRAEKAGSGVDKIMSGWKSSHWRRPFLELYNRPDRVRLTLPMFSVIPQNILEALKVYFSNVEFLSPDELTTLSFALIEGSISNQRLQYALNMHSADITGLLKKLCEQEYLESDSKGRWTTYKLKPKVDTSYKVDTLSKSGDNQKDLTSKVDTLKPKVDTFDLKVETKRLNREELEQLIMTVCEGRYVKMEQVAHEIHRSVDYLKNKIFPKMIKDKKLIKKYPYTHNHPDQGYKTSKETENKNQ